MTGVQTCALPILTFPEVFDGISKADVEDCIRRWVTPERCGLAVVRPGEEA